MQAANAIKLFQQKVNYPAIKGNIRFWWALWGVAWVYIQTNLHQMNLSDCKKILGIYVSILVGKRVQIFMLQSLIKNIGDLCIDPSW